ncbi:asparagine synthase-related protein [Natronococcus roseus]|uniref:asparagine synthase-related protein n=1 Tax=Natronococcus roseus TaxID=1052014 RepID=UPI00374CE7FE
MSSSRFEGRETELNFRHADRWVSKGSAHVRGQVYYDGKLLSQSEFAARVDAIDSSAALQTFLAESNGFFVLVTTVADRVLIAADHVRSWPLFYGLGDQEVYISDDAQWVHERTGEPALDPIAGTEYLHTGFVSADRTLSPTVSQIQAGEVVEVDLSEATDPVTSSRYWKFELGNGNRQPSLKELDEYAVSATERLIEYADGRPILLGLSNGYDSRMIALLLYRLGYENVITYTHDLTAGYAKDEIDAAKSIADDLGFEHVTVNVDHANFREFYQSDAWDEFHEAVGYLGSLPDIGEIVMLRKLLSENEIDENAIQIRGHYLYPASARIPEYITKRNTISRDEFVQDIWEGHYNRWDTHSKEIFSSDPEEIKELRNNIHERIPVDIYQNSETEPNTKALNGYIAWLWQERVPKLLSIDYELDFTGLDKWWPLLDKEYSEFWTEVDYNLVLSGDLHKSYIEWLDTEIRGEDIDPITEFGGGGTGSYYQLKSVYEKAPPKLRKRIRRLYFRVSGYLYDDSYEEDPRYGLLSPETFDQYSLHRLNSKRSNWVALHIALLSSDGFIGFNETTEIDATVPER